MKRKLQKEWLRSYLWSGPSLLLIALVVVFPILYTFYISLTNMNVYHWFDFTIIGWRITSVRCSFSIPGFYRASRNRFVDGGQYDVAAGDCLCAGKPFEYTELAVSEAV